MRGADARLSKLLSYWLRHAPAEGGLTLDSAGWAEVEAVVATLAERGVEEPHTRLLAVVAANDKQRFELSPDGRGIRARQGHSVPVELGWPAVTPPALLFHGTVAAALPAIRAEGLKPMRRHHVHLSPDRDTAVRVGQRRGAPIVLTVEAGRMARAGAVFHLTDNGVWLTAAVPPAFLREDWSA